MAVWLGCGPERPQFSRVGVAVRLGCGPGWYQLSRVGVAVQLGCGLERPQFSRVGVVVESETKTKTSYETKARIGIYIPALEALRP